MTPRRLLVAAVAVVTVVAAGCGLDAVGSGPAATSSGNGGDGGGPLNGGEGGVTTPVDGGSNQFPLDASGDGAVAPGTDGGGSVELLTVALSNASTTPDLTSEGTLDWAHWGVTGSMTPVRHATGASLIGDYTVTGTNLFTGSNSGSGWPIFAKWTNGDASHPNEAGTPSYRYFTGSDDTSITWTVPASTKARELGIYFAVGQAKARVTASLIGTTTTTFVDTDSGATGSQFLRAAIVYAAPVAGTTVRVRLSMVMRHSTSTTSALSFGSVTLH